MARAPRPGLIVFVGPTLPVADVRKLTPKGTVILGPARQGDVWRALMERPASLVLIDGVFEAQPSVWHHELRAALASGVRVYGASSMGALRAAELHPHGMIGVGEIFEAYRSGRRNDDADVALLHADAEHDFRPLSLPTVNAEYAIERAVKAKVLRAAEARALRHAVVVQHYSRRSWATVLAAVAEPVRGQMKRFLDRTDTDLKAADARAALKRASRELGKKAPRPDPVPDFPSHVRRARLIATGAELSGFEQETDQGLRTQLLARLAREMGLRAPPDRVETALADLPIPGWAEDERRRAAEDLVLEQLLLETPEQVFPDGPSRIEGHAFFARVFK